MTSDIPTARRAAVRAYPMTILRYAATGRADGRAQSDGRIRIGIATGRELRLRPRGWGVRISPGRTSTRGIRQVASSMSILRQQLVARLGEPMVAGTTRYIHRLIYWLAPVRQRKGCFPGQMPEYHLLNRQRICILSGSSRPSAETNRADKASRSPILS